ncbi:hypothetical protein IMG5_153230 [Ichthyophthirius multifiliis]|uniref:J domain-containing protein n=1 Tax=Ichthyophthirius multifiliis TaxID=5932 RepID=G0QYY1_ICHMU|nr:hypothetical protein IMG5_153230 [Ichthyophthirius multifiliis]EGR29552.1 hypothetical protein IMG5_153230 [Ichthyophthirius multifiliis]|eukprot:XP_004030788.1 hypothetical protein IMG5_153230 [Ichthyophthirius multifiliis]
MFKKIIYQFYNILYLQLFILLKNLFYILFFIEFLKKKMIFKTKFKKIVEAYENLIDKQKRLTYDLKNGIQSDWQINDEDIKQVVAGPGYRVAMYPLNIC